MPATTRMRWCLGNLWVRPVVSSPMNRMMDSVRAVIFDMDGVMLDTEPLERENFRRAAADFGRTINDDIYSQVVGRNSFDTKEFFESAYGAEFPYEDIRARWREYTYAHTDRFGVERKPGIGELLDRISALRLPMAVATSTKRDRALGLLEHSGLLPYFSAIVGGDEVQNGKPDPEIFLTAAARLGAESQYCLVFEDSAYGIRAAHAAGMIPILVPDTVQPPAEVRQLASRVFTSLHAARVLFEDRQLIPDNSRA